MDVDFLFHSNIFFGVIPLVTINNKWIPHSFKQRILAFQIHKYLVRLWKLDVELDFEKIDSLDETSLNTLCIDRAIDINDVSREEKIKDLKIWTLYSDRAENTDVALI